MYDGFAFYIKIKLGNQIGWLKNSDNVEITQNMDERKIVPRQRFESYQIIEKELALDYRHKYILKDKYENFYLFDAEKMYFSSNISQAKLYMGGWHTLKLCNTYNLIPLLRYDTN